MSKQAASNSFKGHLRDLGFEFEDADLEPMIGRLAAAQAHRLTLGNSGQTPVTRSTALAVFGQMDPQIESGLRAGGLDWERYLKALALTRPIDPHPVTDVPLHPDFGAALERFAAAQTDPISPTPLNLARAIVEMAAADPEAGVLAERLKKFGADPAELPGRLLAAATPEPATEPPPAPNAWICQFASDEQGGNTLRERGRGETITWYWKSHQHIRSIRPGDPVVYLRQIDRKKKDRGGIVGTGRVVSNEPKPTVIRWRGSEPVDGLQTEIVETFVDDLIPRDDAITDPPFPNDKNWRGSVIDLTPEQASRINQALIDVGREPIFKHDTGPKEDTRTDFQPDDAELDTDLLNRGPLAISLARFIHRVWLRNNDIRQTTAPRRESPDRRLKSRAGFVFHLDAPWGGGKTTFANFIARVLDPVGHPVGPKSFLHRELRRGEPAALFLADADATEELERWPKDARRPWIVVNFNAWQNEHVDPPWWVFYQTIRRQCFKNLTMSGLKPFAASGSKPRYGKTSLRQLNVFRLWLHEIWWRLTSPKIALLALTALASLGLLLLFQRLEMFGQLGVAVVSLTGSLSFLWSLAAVVTESIVPGTDTLAERLSLGKGDPFERFRRHFFELCKRVRRPILVVIDDLDRCRPDAVVGLVRGLQTILRSPRVVYLILGDRDWIERAFEAEHDEMKAIDVGDEQSFGARFVEKAIQISLLLPDASPDERKDYVSTLLDPRPASAGTGDAETDQGTTKDEVDERTRERAREIVSKMEISDFYLASNRAAKQMDVSTDDHSESAKSAKRLLRSEIVKKAGRDERVSEEVAHQLKPLAGSLPANPRQIKRIINSITVYQQFAMMSGLLEGDDSQRRWRQLVLWVVLMIEWPRTWRWLAAYPLLADLAQADEARWEKLVVDANADLHGRLEAAARQIKSEESAMAILSNADFDPDHPVVIDQQAVDWLRTLTPVYRTELPDESPPPGATTEA